MSTAGARLSVLLLTEDGRDDALRALVIRLLGRIAPGAVTRQDAQTWEPVTPEARAVVQANGWKNPRRRDLVSFRQYIAAKLVRENGFVFFHVDGDRAYREHVECPDETENASRHGCAEKLAAWRRDRSLLDEVHQPKQELCFRDEHNAELASLGYPLDDVLGAAKSLHDALLALRSCPELMAALERQTPSWLR